jgi:hypothetical protein
MCITEYTEGAEEEICKKLLCTIRRFEPADASDVSQLIIDNLTLVNMRDYGEAAIRQLLPFYSPHLLQEYARSGEMIVPIQDASIVGTGALNHQAANKNHHAGARQFRIRSEPQT